MKQRAAEPEQPVGISAGSKFQQLPPAKGIKTRGPEEAGPMGGGAPREPEAQSQGEGRGLGKWAGR